MFKQSLFLLAAVLVFLPILLIAADDDNRPVTNKARLKELSQFYTERLSRLRTQQYFDLLNSTNELQRRLNNNPDIQLMYIRENGQPVYYGIDNLNAAKTISTDDVWPGGSGGFSLSGLGTSRGKLGIWDGGSVLLTHQEFDGRVAQVDSPGATHYHATHVAGTMVAAGVSPNAKGMSFEAYLNAYDWTNDEAEMAMAGGMGMNISNHSYGEVTGWQYEDGNWSWYGDLMISSVEDYGFGFYGSVTEAWDEIAYNAPYYLICKSAGNDRNDYGPGTGGGHFVLVGSNWVWRTDTRDIDGGSDHYDCIPKKGNAKNIMTVGAVNDYPNGYSDPGSVNMTSFSGWGPTDDGRIKPDIVANGASLYSATDAGNTSYITIGGTSMSAPNASGSLNLLVRYYESTHNDETPLSSTIKVIALHTADEAGPDPGPDYMFGWGMMNTAKAATLIVSDIPNPERIVEGSLQNSETDIYNFSSDGIDPIRVTIVWTDPPGTPPPTSLNPTTPMLVNDLDIRLEHIQTTSTYFPYIMNPSNPSEAASTGDNSIDNVEQIQSDSPPAGDYRVTVSHKGTLAAEQWYSLIITNQILSCVDQDADGYGDPENPGNRCPDDNCPEIFNPDQDDTDTDNVGTVCDNCPDKYNPGQEDLDFDTIGDACDYVCGNVDNDDDNLVNILDVVFLINSIYKEGTDPVYLLSADVKYDGLINILDVVYLINSIYKDGPDPECE